MEIDEPSPRVSSPPRIRRLEEGVVNRIAAGEVIQRPSAAVKELVENSLDASATSVSVSVKDGGLKLLLVSDDGHGIRHEDLPILCERHTTSKLAKYEDLQTIKSMGFRGEALASMTYVAHVTVTTITPGQLHGYRVSYRDGVMEHEPRPCAAVKGTQIMVENLFYNMAARRKMLQNSNDEYPKIVDLISRFAVHHTNVNFSCRKYGANRVDVHTVGGGSSRLDVIRAVYGASVARDLMRIVVSDDDPDGSIFEMEGFISNANYVAKKTTMILFINDRLVECTSLKRAIEVVYTATLPKASKPFIYISINLPSEHVDVNIHPTKREVSLLNQERLIETIKTEIESKLMSSNTTRIFQTQVVSSTVANQINVRKDKEQNTPISGKESQKVAVNKIVRTDSRDPFGRLHAYWKDGPSSQQSDKKPDLVSVRNTVIARRNLKEDTDFTTLDCLVREIDFNVHPGLLDIVKNCTYIGLADEIFALLQYNTSLYLVNVVNVSKELMYQQAVRRFAHFNAIQLSEPAPLMDLLLIALREEDLDSNDEGYKLKIAEMNVELLKEKAGILDDYFCIKINEEGNLIRLPVVLDQYTPDMDRLPEFVLSLGNDVDWTDEMECFQTISAVIANFYALHPPILPNPSGTGIQFYKKNRDNTESNNGSTNNTEEELDEELIAEAETEWAQREWNIQHVLFPSMRLFLKPTKSMATNGTFIQVASLEKLYKVFERC